jgi:hypothetical protein
VKDEYNHLVLEKIQQTPNKKFYLALDMNLVKNPLVYDDFTFGMEEEEPWTSSQINNITFYMPHIPVIYQYRKIAKV